MTRPESSEQAGRLGQKLEARAVKGLEFFRLLLGWQKWPPLTCSTGGGRQDSKLIRYVFFFKTKALPTNLHFLKRTQSVMTVVDLEKIEEGSERRGERKEGEKKEGGGIFCTNAFEFQR